MKSVQTRGQYHHCLFYLKYAKERLTCSLPVSSIQTMSYITCKVEIQNFTQPSLHHFTDKLLNNIDRKKISVIVLLDMSKAFDSIRHDLMLRKLRKAGVSESACAWFESYLSQRQQVVKFQNTVSDPLSLRVGVPRGSIMGPVLFTLYVNDLFRVPKHCEPLGYVDDTKLFLGFPASELDDVISAVNEDLKEISIWRCRNSLFINPDKTKLLYVGVPQLMRTLPTPLPSATMLGTQIKPVTVAKDPGVYIDCHIFTLTNKSLKLPLTVCLN